MDGETGNDEEDEQLREKRWKWRRLITTRLKATTKYTGLFIWILFTKTI